jgi:hypothetical protein
VLDLAYWEREAQFADNDNDRAAARKKVLEMSTAARQLAECEKQLTELEQVAAELNARRPTPRDFRM